MSSANRRAAVLVCCLLCAAACGSETSPGFGEGGSSGGGGASGGTSNGGIGGDPDGGVREGGTGECVATEASASLVRRPVDVVFTIDNSGSMSDEIAEVEEQINQNFASIIGQSGIDYRVIMLSKFGGHTEEDEQNVCISAPLSGTSCDPIPDQPVAGERFFHHSVEVKSHDAFCKVLEEYSRADDYDQQPEGYGALLRGDAFKVFVVITDDNVDAECEGVDETFDDRDTAAGGERAAERFDRALLALSPEQFGTAENRNYRWHSIVGLAGFDPADPLLAHPPDAPIVTATCPESSKASGTGYQALSRLSGGLRYPSCGLDYTTIFREIATGIVQGARIACDFPLPTPPDGVTLDVSTLVARFTPADGSPVQSFYRVENAAACEADSFYVDDSIQLCPSTCDAINAKPGDFKITYGCSGARPR